VFALFRIRSDVACGHVIDNSEHVVLFTGRNHCAWPLERIHVGAAMASGYSHQIRAVQSLDGNWNKNVRRLEKVYSKTDHT